MGKKTTGSRRRPIRLRIIDDVPPPPAIDCMWNPAYGEVSEDALHILKELSSNVSDNRQSVLAIKTNGCY
jgi:hypothetical protein